MDQCVSPALILVDFQRDFCEKGGYADHHGGIAWAQDAIVGAAKLLAHARKIGIPVIHTREGYASDLSDCHAQKLQRSRRGNCEIGSNGPLGRLLIRGEYGHDFIDQLKPEVGEIIIDKAAYSAFHQTELLEQLVQRNITDLFITGVTADVCVHSTLRSATEFGYNCHYVADAISTFDPQIRIACERMVEVEGGLWGTLADVDASIQWLNRYTNSKI